jgi:hypothetical protein
MTSSNLEDEEELRKKKALEGLLGVSADSYKDSDKYRDHLLEQYRIYVEMADKISERRANNNKFFLSVNGFLLSILGILPQFTTPLSEFNLVWVPVVGVAGIVFCRTWIQSITNYAKLNEEKFTIIQEIEKKLPVKPYLIEWNYLPRDDEVKEKIKKGAKGKVSKYFPLTRLETKVPWVCIILYAALIIGWVLVYFGILPASIQSSGVSMNMTSASFNR